MQVISFQDSVFDNKSREVYDGFVALTKKCPFCGADISTSYYSHIIEAHKTTRGIAVTKKITEKANYLADLCGEIFLLKVMHDIQAKKYQENPREKMKFANVINEIKKVCDNVQYQYEI